MSEWYDSSEKLFENWKNFRDSIENKSEVEQLSEIASFFSTAPIGKENIDLYNPENWLSPWEILNNRDFCVSSVSVLMYVTYDILNGNDKMKLIIVDDGRQYILPLFDGQYVLNFHSGRVVNIGDVADKINIIGTVQTTKYSYKK